MGEAMVRSKKFAAAENPLLEEILHKVFNYIDHPEDRNNISRVCKEWLAADRDTRKHVYVAFTYSVSPGMLIKRFKNLGSLKLKGKPRAYEFNLLPENWGGAVGPWVNPIVKAYPSLCALHLRRMEVTDDDLKDLASGFQELESLKLDFCSGFSTSGLLAITRFCRHLKVLYLENSNIRDDGVEWLRELALNNRCLEELDFQLVDFNGLQDNSIIGDYLKDIVRNCNLKSLKFSNVDGDNLRWVLSKSTSLNQLGVIFTSFDDNDGMEAPGRRLELPTNLTSISGDIPVPLISSVASKLVKLDLMTSSKTAGEHHELIKSCPNLLNLQVRTIVGDQGLSLVAQSCKKLQKIRVEEQGDEDVFVSQEGLISLVNGCNRLRKLTIYVSNISNAALVAVGKCCPELVDFRLVLTETDTVPDTTSVLPVDEGFLAIMKGCTMLSRLCIYVRRGALSDQGMAMIGSHGSRLKALLLGGIGESDAGFLALARGCSNLERLEMRDCVFTDDALVEGVKYLKKLKLLWVQGYVDRDHKKLLNLDNGRDGWKVEYNPGSNVVTVTFLMYRSLVPGRRTDCPDNIISPRNVTCNDDFTTGKYVLQALSYSRLQR